ncbi:apoptosis regulator Bcl-2-like [Halichoeres trimaculatus]|uniref:apoptosis regulator Bcl-2-like n=1 Tax=Halichoeres trimaculatus TaxID=147232 RepID=UPI003D9E5EE6
MATTYNSLDLVEDFLRLRLQQDGLDWRDVLPLRRPHTTATSYLTSWRAALVDFQPGQPQLQVVLQSACRNLARRYAGNLAAHFPVLMRSDISDLVVVREELFRDGVNWGRILTMMEVGGALCAEMAETGGALRVNGVAGWMAEGLDSLQGWIEDNGGWEAFMELYGESSPAVNIWSLSTLFGLALLGATVITLVTMFTQR